MAINPYIDLFGTGGAGRTLATGAGAAAGAAAGLPWSIIIPVGLSLLGSLLSGKSEEEKRQEELYNQILPYLSRNLAYQTALQSRISGILPIVQQAILNQIKRTYNWGWPEGKGIDLDFLESLLSNPTRTQENYGLPGESRRIISRSALSR